MKKGCFYGLAIGDALGAAVEFQERGTFPEVTGYRGGGVFNLNPGQWTDDTSMALALADSIAQTGWSSRDQLSRYAEWREHGKYSVNGACFDIGGTTNRAIDRFLAEDVLIAESDPIFSGNGSIMRLAPVMVAFSDIPTPIYVERLIQSSQTTHASDYSTESCVFLGLFLKELSERVDRVQAFFNALYGTKCGKIPRKYFSDWINGDVDGSGFVLDSIKASLWAFMTSNSFEEAVLRAVNLGDDADTTGAVVGQMAGAYWGYSQIPTALIDGLDRKDMIDLYLNPIL